MINNRKIKRNENTQAITLSHKPEVIINLATFEVTSQNW